MATDKFRGSSKSPGVIDSTAKPENDTTATGKPRGVRPPSVGPMPPQKVVDVKQIKNPAGRTTGNGVGHPHRNLGSYLFPKKGGK